MPDSGLYGDLWFTITQLMRDSLNVLSYNRVNRKTTLLIYTIRYRLIVDTK